MMRDDEWDGLRAEPVRVTLAVDALMVKSHHHRDLGVLVDMPKDALPDGRVFLHLAALLERQRTRFLEEAWRQTNFSDVVNEPAEIGMLLNLDGEAHSLGDVPGVNCNCCRVSCRVPVPRVKCRDKRRGELKVRPRKRLVRRRKICGESTLALI